jgi:hypothetical protein
MAKLGIKSKLYYRSAGDYANPTFTEINLISDLSVQPAWDKGDASSRGSRVKKSVKTMLGLSFSGKLKKKPNDAAYEAIMDALISDEVLDVMVLDGDSETDGTRGWRFDAQVFQGNEDQGLGAVICEDIEIEPTDSDNEPKAVLVSGTAGLTYSDIGGDAVAFA